MGESKINIKIGHVEFSGEGEQEWLGAQLDKIIVKAPELLRIELNAAAGAGTKDEKADLKKDEKNNGHSNVQTGTLASWLSDKKVSSNQTKKFLATAAHVQLNGTNRMTTADVKSALNTSNQGKLGNASECLNQNVKQGFIVKEGRTFYVTPEGLKELGV